MVDTENDVDGQEQPDQTQPCRRQVLGAVLNRVRNLLKTWSAAIAGREVVMTTSAFAEPSATPVLSAIRSRPRLKAVMKRYLEAVGYDTTDWVRVAMYRHAFEFIGQLGPERLRVLEVSAGSQWKSKFAFESFMGTSYPTFDICKDVLPDRLIW